MLSQEGEEALRRLVPPIIIPNNILIRTPAFSIYNPSNDEPVVAWSANALELVHQDTSETRDKGDEDNSPGLAQLVRFGSHLKAVVNGSYTSSAFRWMAPTTASL